MNTTIVRMHVDDRPIKPDGFQLWNTTYAGDMLLSRVRDPEHASCRALLARGILGRVTFVHDRTGAAGLSMDIEKGAGLTAVERDDRGISIEEYRPFPSTVRGRTAVKGSGGVYLPADTNAAPAPARIEGGRP